MVGLYLWNNKDIIYPYHLGYISLEFRCIFIKCNKQTYTQGFIPG
nr:MAG TPA: hypothetical protein [Caudoviricetes sp.]